MPCPSTSPSASPHFPLPHSISQYLTQYFTSCPSISPSTSSHLRVINYLTQYFTPCPSTSPSTSPHFPVPHPVLHTICQCLIPFPSTSSHVPVPRPVPYPSSQYLTQYLTPFPRTSLSTNDVSITRPYTLTRPSVAYYVNIGARISTKACITLDAPGCTPKVYTHMLVGHSHVSPKP